jgi:hypothetical protein
MKHFIVSLLLMVFSLPIFSQTTIYSENCGTPSAVTSVATYTGWQQKGIQTYTGNADVRTTVASTGYVGASGGGNIFITNTLNTNCTISGINTIGYTGVCLQFGILKTANGSNGTNLAVEYSTDGLTWSALSFTMPTGSGSSNVWSYIQPTCGCTDLPSTTNLRIKFRMASLMTGLQFRIDDIKVIGTPVILPIELNTFYIDKFFNTNKLYWTTLSEKNVNRFEIERSNDLKNWEYVGHIAANGFTSSISEYTFYDNTPLYGVSYYRLVSIDNDGEKQYSRIVGITNKDEETKKKYYTLMGHEVTELIPETYYIEVVNGIGKKIFIIK